MTTSTDDLMPDHEREHDHENDCDVIVSIDLDADPDAVWDAITSDAGLGTWLGTGARIDAEPGGVIEAPDIVTGRPRRGRVDTVESGERLAFTWWPEDDPSTCTSVTLVVEPGVERTRLTVTERVPATASAPTSAAWEWRAALVTVPLAAFVAC